MHGDRELLDGFLDWLNLQVSGLTIQIHLNKIQLQQLLLGIGLLIRDLQFCCFTNQSETALPEFLLESCMAKEDALAIGAILDKLSKIVYNYLK